MQREDCCPPVHKVTWCDITSEMGLFNEAEEIASLNMGARNQYSSINFLGGFIEGISIVNFCGRFLYCCVWLRGKSSQVLVDRWITSETFHEVQNANRCCTGHATMSTGRGNYRLITVHAPFLAIAPNQKAIISDYCMEAPSHWLEMKNSGRCSPWNLPIHVSRTARL